MERIFQIIAAALLIAAIYLLWRGVTDWSFVCCVLAGCAFFLSMRFQIKERMAERTATEVESSEDEKDTLIEPDHEIPSGCVENSSVNTTLHS
jgi:hypothetical protein